MRVERVGSAVADMVLIPDRLTHLRDFPQPSRIVPAADEIITSMSGYSDAGFVTTTYRMKVVDVTTVRSTHAEWLISSREVVGLGSRLVVRHFNLPQEDGRYSEGSVVLKDDLSDEKNGMLSYVIEDGFEDVSGMLFWILFVLGQ